MPRGIEKNKKRFYYNMEMEMALRQIFEKKYFREASLFENPNYIKEAMLDWTNKIKKRVFELTEHDLRLREMVFLDLDNIAKEIKGIPKEYSEWRIIPKLMMIISRLLGYDWCDGNVNRHVFYFQTINQEYKDYRNQGKSKPMKQKFEFYNNINSTILKVVHYLEKEGYDSEEISTILKTSKSTIERLRRREKNAR